VKIVNMNDEMNDWRNEWIQWIVNAWMNECRIKIFYEKLNIERRNEWMNEWIKWWMDGWKNGLMNE